MEKDEQVLEDSFVSIMSAVLNKWETAHLENGRYIGKKALDDIIITCRPLNCRTVQMTLQRGWKPF